jgi:hypothetical protein
VDRVKVRPSSPPPRNVPRMFPGIAPYGKAIYTGSRNEWFFEVIGDVLHHIWYEVFNRYLTRIYYIKW